jgi:hypothetical protein
MREEAVGFGKGNLCFGSNFGKFGKFAERLSFIGFLKKSRFCFAAQELNFVEKIFVVLAKNSESFFQFFVKITLKIVKYFCLNFINLFVIYYLDFIVIFENHFEFNIMWY